MHLGVNEFSNVVTTVRPFENTKSINFALNKITSVNVNVVMVDWAEISPLFKTFSINMPVFKIATNLYFTVV